VAKLNLGILQDNHRESDLQYSSCTSSGRWSASLRNSELLLLWPIEQQMLVRHFLSVHSYKSSWKMRTALISWWCELARHKMLDMVEWAIACSEVLAIFS